MTSTLAAATPNQKPTGLVVLQVTQDGGLEAVSLPHAEPFAMFADYPDVMSTRQAAEALGTSPSRMLTLTASGAIKSFNVGRCIKIPKTALFEFIEKGGA